MSTKLDQALIQAFIDGSFGLPIAYENAGYKPTAGVAHAVLSVATNEERGFTLNDLNDITGFLQVVLKYPEGSGAIAAKTMRDSIFAAFPVGQVLTYSGQSLEITGNSRVSARNDSGWYRVTIRINFVAYLPR